MRKIVARIKLSGLDNSFNYTIKAFGGLSTNSADTEPARMKINGNYSNIVKEKSNGSVYMILENCNPISRG